jgi:hypothetical protein
VPYVRVGDGLSLGSGPKSCARCGGRIPRANEVTGWVGEWCGCASQRSALTPPDTDLWQEIARLKERIAVLESRTSGLIRYG